MRKLMLILLVGLALAMGGCVNASAGGQLIERPSLAQEMRDLEAARDSGAISQAEYDTLRKRISENYNKSEPAKKKTHSYHWP